MDQSIGFLIQRLRVRVPSLVIAASPSRLERCPHKEEAVGSIPTAAIRVYSLTVEYETFNFADEGSSPSIPICEFLWNYTSSLLYISSTVWYNRSIK